jgi:hypothetical protein
MEREENEEIELIREDDSAFNNSVIIGSNVYDKEDEPSLMD